MRIIFAILLFAVGVTAQMPKIEPGVSQDLAKWRAVNYSNISYKLNLTLEKMSPVLKGTIEIRVTQAAYACAEPDCPKFSIILDWRKIPGHEKDSVVSNVGLNGVALNGSPLLTRGLSQPGAQVGDKDAEARASARAVADHSYEESNEHLIFRDGVRMGENVIKLDFTSPILTSGSAITRYVDKEDGAEYLYSLFVPSDASTAFPVFDQPDLKGKFELLVHQIPSDWKIVSNSRSNGWTIPDCERLPPGRIDSESLLKATPGKVSIANSQAYESPGISSRPPGCQPFMSFAETKPISTYVFAFAAGPFEQVSEPPALAGGTNAIARSTLKTGSQLGSNATSTPPANAGGSDIYVRKSQAAKFKPHAAEVFRLNREGIRFLETYFDYKLPFPKYDLVLVTEFPFGGMEHAGATFLRESAVIFPTEPTKGDYISRANLIFHETAHQWFGDMVTMRWFDDLWLKEGFAEFMAYKTLEKVMPDANAWKVFYERNKQAAYATDSTKGTTPIYQPIANLSAAKSAYGNIVYRKAPSFLRQAEYYVSPQRFQSAVRTFLKKYSYANAGWQDLVTELETAHEQELKTWAKQWVLTSGVPVIRVNGLGNNGGGCMPIRLNQTPTSLETGKWSMNLKILVKFSNGRDWDSGMPLRDGTMDLSVCDAADNATTLMLFPNYQDYGYGIFLLDPRSRDYVLKNIQNEKDPFLRSMMWGSLWDSVREAELDPREYVELVIKQLGGQVSEARTSVRAEANRSTPESDETIIQSLLGRVSTALNYYLSEPPASAGGQKVGQSARIWPPANAGGSPLNARLEAVLLDRLQNAPTAGQRITFYRAFVANASTAKGREVLKQMLTQGSSATPPAKAGTPPNQGGELKSIPLRTKDRFDIVTRLIILGDPDAPKLLASLEKTETSDDAKRYAYAAKAGFATAENKARYWNDFINSKDISESWIEAAMSPFNSIRHADLTLPYLERALKELPNHKRNRKIFFVNGWLGAFIGGQRSERALAIVNKFLADNPNLDNDLRLKILENVDVIERAVKIRAKFGGK